MKSPAKSVFFLLVVLCISVPVSPQQKAPARQSAERRRVVRVEDPLQSLLAQADAAIEKKEFARAVESLKKYLAEKPDDAFAHFQLGYAHVGLAQQDAARQEFSRAIELDPKLAEAHLNMGLLLLNDDPAAAIAPLARAAELLPRQARVRFLLAGACGRAGRPAEALESYRVAVRLDPKDPEIRLAFARALLAAKRPVEAEPEFRAVLEARPDAAQARLGLADCLLAQNKPDQAAVEFAAFLQQNPDERETRMQFAALLADLQKYSQALVELDRAEASLEPTLDGLKLRARIYFRQKKLADAIAALEKALPLAPQDAELHAFLGRLWLEKREFPPAERELMVALKLNPGLTDAVRDLVAVHYLGENYSATLSWQDELARRELPNAGWWFVRAICYDKLRRIPEAIAAYEKFLALDLGKSEDRDFQARQRIRILKLELERKK